MKSICNKIWNFLDFLILKNFSKFLENSREISLLDLDLEAFSIHFSLSISILRHFHFTFHSRSRYQGIFISLFILEMSEPDFHFTFHFSKWVNQISISLFTSRTSNIHSRRTLIYCMYLDSIVAHLLYSSRFRHIYPFLVPDINTHRTGMVLKSQSSGGNEEHFWMFEFCY